MQNMVTGKLIFVHGASSSGKSTLCRALQAEIEEPFWHYSIDHFRDAGILPMERYQRKEFDWQADREAFFDGYHRSIAAFLQAGNSIVLEHIIETAVWKAQLLELFEGLDVFFVGLHCDVDELERRELARGDRTVGSARKDFETIHEGMEYDLVLDGMGEVDKNVEVLLNGWKQRKQPSTFFEDEVVRD